MRRDEFASGDAVESARAAASTMVSVIAKGRRPSQAPGDRARSRWNCLVRTRRANARARRPRLEPSFAPDRAPRTPPPRSPCLDDRPARQAGAGTARIPGRDSGARRSREDLEPGGAGTPCPIRRRRQDDDVGRRPARRSGRSCAMAIAESLRMGRRARTVRCLPVAASDAREQSAHYSKRRASLLLSYSRASTSNGASRYPKRAICARYCGMYASIEPATSN